MAVSKKRMEKNLHEIRERIALSCAKVGRDPKEVTLIAVTKSVELDEIRHLLDLGVTELGESRVQQFVPRASEVGAYLQRRRVDLPRPVRWHMVGHLQRNKVKGLLEWASLIHSVDSLRLAEEISHRAEQMHRTVEVLLQVNCSGESQKFGCAVGAAEHLAELIATLPHVRLVGLMTMGPLSDNAEDARPAFRRLRELFEDMRKSRIGGDAFRHLSMGMSRDYPQAVEEGATLVRIGSALFA